MGAARKIAAQYALQGICKEYARAGLILAPEGSGLRFYLAPNGLFVFRPSNLGLQLCSALAWPAPGCRLGP